MRRKITLAFLILAAFLLQTTVFQYFQIASVTPNLLLILTSAFGLMRGKKEGLMVGFFSGLMIDLFYGSLFGFYALLYMYIGSALTQKSSPAFPSPLVLEIRVVTIFKISFSE